MLQYNVKRLIHFVPLLIGVSIIGFSVMHFALGGPLAVYNRIGNLLADVSQAIIDPRVRLS